MMDKLKETFSVLNAKEKVETKEEVKNKQAEQTVTEEVNRYSKDMNVMAEPKKRERIVADAPQGINGPINRSKRLRSYEPTKFLDVNVIGEEIKNGKIVTVSCKNLRHEEAMQVEYFLYGVCHALDIEPEFLYGEDIISIDPQLRKDEN